MILSELEKERHLLKLQPWENIHKENREDVLKSLDELQDYCEYILNKRGVFLDQNKLEKGIIYVV